MKLVFMGAANLLFCNLFSLETFRLLSTNPRQTVLPDDPNSHSHRRFINGINDYFAYLTLRCNQKIIRPYPFGPFKGTGNNSERIIAGSTSSSTWPLAISTEIVAAITYDQSYTASQMQYPVTSKTIMRLAADGK
jgi:hypothetical protein